MANFSFDDDDTFSLSNGADEGVKKTPKPFPNSEPVKSQPISTADLLAKVSKTKSSQTDKNETTPRPSAPPARPVAPRSPTPQETALPEPRPLNNKPAETPLPVATPQEWEDDALYVYEEEAVEIPQIRQETIPPVVSEPVYSNNVRERDFSASSPRPSFTEAPAPAPSNRETIEQSPAEEPSKKTKNKKNSSKEKTPKANIFAGGRRKILFIRIAVGVVLLVLLFNGLTKLFAPPAGPTRAQVESAAQEAVGFTGFPTTAAEGLSLGFTRVFLNYSSDAESREARNTLLLNYAPEEIVRLIDPVFGRTGAEDEQEAIGTEVTDVNQVITEGPYIVNSVNIDETRAVITTVAKVNNTGWKYLAIPMIFDPETNAISVYSTPSFVPPIETAAVRAGDSQPQWRNDTDISGSVSDRLREYLTAWSVSDAVSLDALLARDATLTARQGLGVESGLTLTNLSGVSVELKSDEDPTINERRVQLSATWNDAANRVSYTQDYRLIIIQGDTGWLVEDIQNLALISGEATAEIED